MRGLLVGVLLGAAGGAGATLLLAPPGEVDASTHEPGVTSATSVDVPQLQRELQALQQRLRDVEAASARQAAEAPTQARPAAPELSRAEAAVLDELLRLLGEQFHAGMVRQHFASCVDDLVALLVSVWCSCGSPERGLEMFMRLPEVACDAEMVADIGDALLQRGDRALATRVYLLGLQRTPDALSLVHALLDLDPGAALAVIDEELARRPGEPELREQWHAQRVALLLAAGRREEALPLIDKLITDGDMGGDDEDEGFDFWELLIRHDPGAALERLRVQLGKADDESRSAWELRVARATRIHGDVAAARRMLLEQLARQPDHDAALDELGEFDRAAAIAHAKARVTADDSRETWQRLAHQYEAGKRTDDAVAAYWEAWQRDLTSELHDKLLELDPQRNLEPVLRLAREKLAGHKDELCGEVLGDAAKVLWRSGQRQRAIALWQEARRRDPEDSEWPDRLRRATAGQNPLD